MAEENQIRIARRLQQSNLEAANTSSSLATSLPTWGNLKKEVSTDISANGSDTASPSFMSSNTHVSSSEAPNHGLSHAWASMPGSFSCSKGHSIQDPLKGDDGEEYFDSLWESTDRPIASSNLVSCLAPTPNSLSPDSERPSERDVFLSRQSSSTKPGDDADGLTCGSPLDSGMETRVSMEELSTEEVQPIAPCNVQYVPFYVSEEIRSSAPVQDGPIKPNEPTCGDLPFRGEGDCGRIIQCPRSHLLTLRTPGLMNSSLAYYSSPSNLQSSLQSPPVTQPTRRRQYWYSTIVRSKDAVAQSSSSLVQSAMQHTSTSEQSRMNGSRREATAGRMETSASRAVAQVPDSTVTGSQADRESIPVTQANDSADKLRLKTQASMFQRQQLSRSHSASPVQSAGRLFGKGSGTWRSVCLRSQQMAADNKLAADNKKMEPASNVLVS